MKRRSKMSKKEGKQFNSDFITGLKEISSCKTPPSIIEIACIMVKNLKPYIKSVKLSGTKRIKVVT